MSLKHSKHVPTISSADAEIARDARCWTQRLLPLIRKTPHFPYPTGLPQYNSESQDTVIRVGFGNPAAKTLSYLVVRRFPLFVALCDHNSPTLPKNRRTDGRTDVMLVVSAQESHNGMTR